MPQQQQMIKTRCMHKTPTQKQESVFRTLEQSMHKCSNVLLLLAATDVIMGHISFQAEGDLLELYASLADAFHELVTALMVRYGSKSFRAVFKTHGHDIRNLLAGLVSLGNVLLEIAVISAWLVRYARADSEIGAHSETMAHSWKHTTQAVVQVATATALWPWTLGVCAVCVFPHSAT